LTDTHIFMHGLCDVFSNSEYMPSNLGLTVNKKYDRIRRRPVLT
jgi:hypothetical protein